MPFITKVRMINNLLTSREKLLQHSSVVLEQDMNEISFVFAFSARNLRLATAAKSSISFATYGFYSRWNHDGKVQCSSILEIILKFHS